MTTTATEEAAPARDVRATEPPRLGFLGVGWIGRNRLDALVEAGAGSVAAVADPSAEATAAVREEHPDAEVVDGLEELLELRPDGLVIATPSAMHAEQAIAALERGIPVFCQKPVGRTADEARAVVGAARRADRLLGVDMSYRHTAAMAAIRERVRAGALGEVYAADLVFHNAYGPDKEWFYDRGRSGGGALMDLGIHLVDLALWTMGGRVESAEASLYAGGRPVRPGADGAAADGAGDEAVEDYAEARVVLDGGRVVRVACSWNLSAGRDAVIEARFHGTEAGAAMLNADGSFYDLKAELYRGTATETLVEPPDDWGGRAAVEWARHLASDPSFDPAADELVEVAEVVDRLYGR